jgi:hypothetical protein
MGVKGNTGHMEAAAASVGLVSLALVELVLLQILSNVQL